MKLPIVIALGDSDHFFIQGMQYILKAYFHTKGVPIVFMPFTSAHVIDLNRADLIVKGATDWVRVGYERQTIVIVRKNVLEGDETFSLRGIISRRENPEAVAHLLDELFDSSSTNQLHHNAAYAKISAREREVLRGIAAELTPYQIGKSLQISTKTVSTHKYAAMRKLGLKRTHDLYNWLLHGGMTSEDQRLGI